jgi:4-alpha-glucanotransferase
MTEQLVEPTYIDAFKQRREIAPDVRDAVLRTMGAAAVEGADDVPHVLVAPRGSSLPAAGDVRLEDGTELGRLEAIPRDAPHGYHELVTDDGQRQLLITGPGRCHLPRGLRAWGWAIQLSTLRSRASWGIGDFGDLREFARWSGAQGAGFVGVSPLSAPNPSPNPEPSPYYPSTRRFLNPLHLRITDVPGAEALDLAELAAAGRALDDERTIDRARVHATKAAALDELWAAGRFDREAFDAWRGDQGEPLERWSRFCVLSERLGAGWQAWPEPFRDPAGPEVTRVALEARDRVAFHAWVQWLADGQLAAASEGLRRVADMPVGVDPGGFDAWDWQDQLALGASVGAPPDRFNTAGQDWGLPPFIPHRLQEAHYRPFIETVRQQLRFAGGLRIDHVLGLFRLWWIPAGHGAARGAYVRYPTDELLEIVALESQRARAVVVGEDLGTVSPGVRTELRRRRVLSTRLVLFEKTAPSGYPAQSFAAVTTHDLPTVAGAISGTDLRDQAAAGVTPDPAALALLRGRLRAAAGVGADADAETVAGALHRRLAASPSVLVAATLEDALGVEERPNLPGTVIAQRPNWSISLPVPLEDLDTHPGVRATVDALRR